MTDRYDAMSGPELAAEWARRMEWTEVGDFSGAGVWGCDPYCDRRRCCIPFADSTGAAIDAVEPWARERGLWIVASIGGDTCRCTIDPIQDHGYSTWLGESRDPIPAHTILRAALRAWDALNADKGGE